MVLSSIETTGYEKILLAMRPAALQYHGLGATRSFRADLRHGKQGPAAGCEHYRTKQHRNLYTTTDVRRTLILNSSPVRGNVRVVNKYPNSEKTDKDEVKVIRMSEVYLIAAEAAYHTGNEPLARDYLNAVVWERDLAFPGYSSTGTALLNDILLERRKELAFEGHRYWDLVRYNLPVQRVNLSGNYGGVPLTISPTNFRRILPIPQSELDANPAIRSQQNPGY